MGLRPVVVGLIASAALLLMNKENFADYRAVIIAALSLLVVRKTQIHPIWVIVIAGCAGYFIY